MGEVSCWVNFCWTVVEFSEIDVCNERHPYQLDCKSAEFTTTFVEVNVYLSSTMLSWTNQGHWDTTGFLSAKKHQKRIWHGVLEKNKNLKKEKTPLRRQNMCAGLLLAAVQLQQQLLTCQPLPDFRQHSELCQTEIGLVFLSYETFSMEHFN